MGNTRKWINFILFGWMYLTVLGQDTEKCEPGWTRQRDTCYAHFLSPMTWSGAVEYCKSRDAKLVSISWKETQMVIEGMVRHSGQDLWLGLQHVIDRGWVWSDGEPSRYRYWIPVERNKGPVLPWRCGCMIGRQSIAGIRRRFTSRARIGMWMQTDCSMKKSFVCQKPPDMYRRACPRGWYLYGTSCFHGYQVPMTWIMARQACRHFDSDLMTIWSRDVQLFVNSLIIEREGNYWVGLRYNRKEGKWCWLDSALEVTTTTATPGPTTWTCISPPDSATVGGSFPADYTNWGPFLPDSNGVSHGQKCMYLIGKHSGDPGSVGLWNHGICERKLLSICQKGPEYVKVEKRINISMLHQKPAEPENGLITPDTGSTLTKDIVTTNEMFSAFNVPISLLTISIIVAAGILLAHLSIKRPRRPCFTHKKSNAEQYKGSENPCSSAESDYATIDDVAGTRISHPTPVSIVSLVPSGSEDRCIQETTTEASDTNKILKEKHDAVVSELKRQSNICYRLSVEEECTRRHNLGNGNTAEHECQSNEADGHSYLDLSGQRTDRLDVQAYDDKAEGSECSYENEDIKAVDCDLNDDVSLSNKDVKNKDIPDAHLKTRQSTINVCIERNENRKLGDDEYETPVPSGDMYLDLWGGKEEEEWEEEGDEGDWEEEGSYHKYEQPVR